MNEYKYQYFQFAGDPEINIRTDWGYELSEIKKVLVSQTPALMIHETEYPNGFKFLTEIAADSIVFRTNKPLIKNPDGTYMVDMAAI